MADHPTGRRGRRRRLKAAFARYAQSALDASGVAGGAGRETTRAMLEAEAAARGLAVEFDNTGRVIVRGAFESARAVDSVGDALQRTTADVEEQATALQKLYDRYRLVANGKTTADGYTKNVDGSAAGSFNNLLPVDQAFALANNQLKTIEEARIGMQQARDAFDAMQKFTRDSPGSSSFEYQQSTAALYVAARTAFERMTAQQAGTDRGQTRQQPTGNTRTVNINIGGRTTPINVASQEDSNALVGLLRQLESARGSAA